MKSSDDKSQVPAQIADIYDGLARGFDILQKVSAEQSVKYGYFHECCVDRRDFYRQCPYYEGLEDMVGPLKKVEKFMRAREEQMKAEFADVTSAAFVISTSAAISDVVAFQEDLSAPVQVKPPKVPPWWNEDTMEHHAGLLDGVRAGLGSLLRGAWESYYGTTHESSRNALNNLRELFNQFFEVIAPNKEVRESEFFKQKKPPNEDKVHRDERLRYAVHKIRSKEVAEYLGSQIKPILKTYRKLNLLHKRGDIDRDLVRDTVVATAMYLFQWLTAVKKN